MTSHSTKRPVKRRTGTCLMFTSTTVPLTVALAGPPQQKIRLLLYVSLVKHAGSLDWYVFCMLNTKFKDQALFNKYLYDKTQVFAHFNLSSTCSPQTHDACMPETQINLSHQALIVTIRYKSHGMLVTPGSNVFEKNSNIVYTNTLKY